MTETPKPGSDTSRRVHTGGRSSPPPWPPALVFEAWRWRVTRAAVIATALLAIFGLGWMFARITGRPHTIDAAAGARSPTGPAVLYWTCSMHPQIKLPKFGQCPICFMDLVPVEAGGETDTDRPVLELSPRARALARIETAEVRRRELTHEIQMVGKVAADETRITTLSSYVPGRIDRLFVNYTGIFVRKGDHLAEIYSPELLVAQTEYLSALEALERAARAGEGRAPADPFSPAVPDALSSLLEPTRRKMELWGVPADEIERLHRERRPSDHMRIDAPLEGWVLERNAFLGMYVEIGTRLFTLADLRTIWVLLDAYELDIGFIRYGQTVRFETEAFPGRDFEGKVSYIDPVLNPRTRTVKVRVNVANPDVSLRPEMFVRARLAVRIGEAGAVVDNPLAGKWVCPMHPEIVRDRPGDCDDCGMDLVTAESIGLASAETPERGVLSVPATAVLLTGKRAVVYVEREEGDRPVYEGRVVELGPLAGDYYVVVGGLEEGQRVVTRGALMIDSALQIRAQPSMMQPPADRPTDAHEHAESPPREGRPDVPSRFVADAPYHGHAAPAIAAYLDLTAALAADHEQHARHAAATLRKAAGTARPEGLAGDDAEAFSTLVSGIAAAVSDDPHASIDALRTTLPAVTEAVETYLRSFGHGRDGPVYRVHCPMAFDNKGADWLQPDDAVRNAYFGAKMLRCGVVKGVIGPDGKERTPE